MHRRRGEEHDPRTRHDGYGRAYGKWTPGNLIVAEPNLPGASWPTKGRWGDPVVASSRAAVVLCGAQNGRLNTGGLDSSMPA